LSPLGAVLPGRPKGELRVLRATLWTRKLAQSGNSRARGCSLGKNGAGRALFPPSGCGRLGEQHGERSWWRSPGDNGRIMAGSGVRLCRLASHPAGASGVPEPAAKLALLIDAVSLAWTMA